MDPSVHLEDTENQIRASRAFDIPTIPLSASRQDTVDALRNAALTSGFFQLSNIESHVSRELIIQMFEETRRFFQLPAPEKETVSQHDVECWNYL